jgi:hypothetical protein
MLDPFDVFLENGQIPRVLLHKAIGAYLAVPCRFTQPREAVFFLAEGGSKIISKNPLSSSGTCPIPEQSEWYERWRAHDV